MQPIDVSPTNLETVRQILQQQVPEFEVRAFGSRVSWTARETSDLDLVLMTTEPLDVMCMAKLREAFTQSNLPYRVDLVDWASTSERFRKLIERDYVVVQRGNGTKGAVTSSKWREVTLAELIDIKHGFAFKGLSIHDEPLGDVLLTPGNFAIGGGFKGERFKYYDGSIPEDFILSEGDLLVTMTDLSKRSDTLGYPALVPANTDGRRYLHNQRLGKILPKRDGEICTRYIYYVMCSTEYRHEVLASATGTTVKHTSPNRIKQYRFSLPPLPEQRVIAHILGTLDDKIGLNRRMNETLEAMTQALFKSWFVDFDPVRAKVEGHDTGLPQHLANLFPDRLVASELGEIPEGWEEKPLDEIAVFQNGLALQKYRPQANEERLPVVKIAQLRTGRPDSGEWATTNIRPECVIRDGDVVFSWSGSLMVRVWCGGPAALNQHLFRVSSTRHPKWFFLHNIYSHLSDFQSIAAGKATTMGHIKRHHLSDALCAVPASRLFTVADGPLSVMLKQSLSLSIQSRVLTALRDTLLPKLISGDLRVGEAGMTLSEMTSAV